MLLLLFDVGNATDTDKDDDDNDDDAAADDETNRDIVLVVEKAVVVEEGDSLMVNVDTARKKDIVLMVYLILSNVL